MCVCVYPYFDEDFSNECINELLAELQKIQKLM